MDIISTFRKHFQNWAIRLSFLAVMQWSSFAFWPECEYSCCSSILPILCPAFPYPILAAGTRVSTLVREPRLIRMCDGTCGLWLTGPDHRALPPLPTAARLAQAIPATCPTTASSSPSACATVPW